MQVRGYITGEIVFKWKDERQAIGLQETASYPGLTRLTAPDIYLVVAKTPSELVELVKRLQSRSDIEWVEPMEIYGVPQAVPVTR